MNEAPSGHVVSGGMQDDQRTAAETKAGLSVYQRACRSTAASLAGSFATLMLTGCPVGGEGGGAPVGTIGAAMSAKNIEARNEMLAQRRQEQIAMADARQQLHQQQKLEASRAVQAASDRLVLKQEQERAEQQRQQQIAQQQSSQGGGNQGQGNQGGGQGNIPPGQAKK
jgi:hypothetical protein